MRLYVEPMDAVVVAVGEDGRIQIDGEEPRTPTLQERRAIIYSAEKQIVELQEVIELLQSISN